jgi:hypothetical protein
VLQDIIVPEIVAQFATKFDDLDNRYDYDPSDDNLNDIFETFCKFEGLSETLASAVATRINTAAAQDQDDEDDDNEPVFKSKDWARLSDDERKAKVKAFLKKLASVGADARDLKPFLKDLNIGDHEDPYGNKFRVTKTFDRQANRYGHSPNESISEGTISFPNVFNQGHDDDHRNHPLNVIAKRYGFQYSHTTPVTQKNGGVLHHHTWVHPAGHKIGAYANDTKWNSKVSSSSGHVWTGIGTKALDQHLANKAKRYKQQNNESSLPHTDILESILDPASQDRVRAYAQWMNQNPQTSFGHLVEADSPAKDLKEAWANKAKADKTFGQGKDQTDWHFFDYRSGKPK